MICGKYSKNVLKNDLVSYLTFDFTYPTSISVPYLAFLLTEKNSFFSGSAGGREREVC